MPPTTHPVEGQYPKHIKGSKLDIKKTNNQIKIRYRA